MNRLAGFISASSIPKLLSCYHPASGGRASKAALTRAGVKGTCRKRTPVASKIPHPPRWWGRCIGPPTRLARRRQVQPDVRQHVGATGSLSATRLRRWQRFDAIPDVVRSFPRSVALPLPDCQETASILRCLATLRRADCPHERARFKCPVTGDHDVPVGHAHAFGLDLTAS